MKQTYRHKETYVFLINYHFIWCPKRRRKILGGSIKERLERILRETAPKIDCEILALEIMVDHLHLFVSATPQWAPNQIIARFKGKSARILRQEFSALRRMPSLWTRSFFVSTAGNVSADTIRRYIEAQSTRD